MPPLLRGWFGAMFIGWLTFHAPSGRGRGSSDEGVGAVLMVEGPAVVCCVHACVCVCVCACVCVRVGVCVWASSSG